MGNLKWYFAKVMKYLLNPPALKDCHIDDLARVGTRAELARVSVGKHSYVGHQCFMVNTSIGRFCSIGERCCVGGAIHPMEYVSTSPAFISGLKGTKYKYARFDGVLLL